jgi:uncharacterized membrane-anchored protein
MSDKVPGGAAQLMIAMLVVFALVAVYANVQRMRRDKFEKVTIKLVSPTATPTPAR